MIAYVIRRLLIAVPVVIGVTFLSFMMLHLVPGNPAVIMAGVGASAQDIARIERQLGLHRPLLYQYGVFLSHLVHGNLGTSISTGRPVAQEIAQTLPITVTLAICSTVLSILAGFSIGILSAAKQGKFADYSATLITLFGLSMPSFWLGVMLILVFSVKLQWLPTAGWNGALSVILPSVTLGAGAVAVIARMTRSSLLEALSADYVRTARAKGISETWVFLRHALRNALIPSITVIGLEFGILLGGAVITEDVFAIPGLGRLILSAINARDYPTVEGAVLVIGLMFVLVNLVTDILYAVIDPRIRYS